MEMASLVLPRSLIKIEPSAATRSDVLVAAIRSVWTDIKQTDYDVKAMELVTDSSRACHDNPNFRSDFL
jgi:hypothetical protein